MEHIPEKIGNKKPKSNKIGTIFGLNNDKEIQEMDYEEAIIHDKRNHLRIFLPFWSKVKLFYYFLSNLIFYIYFPNHFLNTLFFADEFVSDSLPKSAYSFITTLIIINLLKI